MDLQTSQCHTHGWRAALVARCAALPPMPTAVVYPCDAIALGAAVEAALQGLIMPILVGPEAKVRAAARIRRNWTSLRTGLRTFHTATPRPTAPSP